MTDRPLRPLFLQVYDTQVISILLSADGENDPDILSMNGSVGGLHRLRHSIQRSARFGLGEWNGEFVAQSHSHPDRLQSDLDLIYVGTENDVSTIEGAANELPEADFVKALQFAHGHAREMIRAQKELAARLETETGDAAAERQTGTARNRLSGRRRSH